MEQDAIRFYLRDVNAPDLLVRIHNSPGIPAHPPSLDREHWTVGSRERIRTPARRAQQPLENWSYHSSNVATWTRERDSIPKNQTGWLTSTVSGEMLHSPILWPIMENLSHCRAEGANFIDHQPASQSYHTSRARFDLKLMTLLCSFPAPQNLDLAGIIYANTSYWHGNPYWSIRFIKDILKI